MPPTVKPGALPFTNTPRGSIEADGLTIDVIALEQRTVYGRTEYLITPAAGQGKRWVHATRITWTVAPNNLEAVAS